MENKIAVSVVMGVHNPEQEAFLAAVISICRQTFRDWEMLLCDDGSSERYGALFRQAAALDPRILVLHERAHCGLAHALNHGIFRSRGRYIARMDARRHRRAPTAGAAGAFSRNPSRLQLGGIVRFFIRQQWRVGAANRSAKTTCPRFPAAFALHPPIRCLSPQCAAAKRRIQYGAAVFAM